MSYFLCDLCMKISGTTESSSLTDENYMKHILKSLKRRILKTSLDSLTSNSSCTLALTLNPWDKSILKYIKKLPDHISCDRRNATKYFKQGESRSESLTYVDNEGQLKFRNYFEKLKCYYAVPKRKHNGDREDWRLSNRKTLDQVGDQCKGYRRTLHYQLFHLRSLAGHDRNAEFKFAFPMFIRLDMSAYLTSRLRDQLDFVCPEFIHFYLLGGRIEPTEEPSELLECYL